MPAAAMVTVDPLIVHTGVVSEPKAGGMFATAELIWETARMEPAPAKIRVKVPNGALTGPVTVHTPAGDATSADPLTVKPTIKSFSPTSGPVGTVVTIRGSAFTGATKVLFHGTKATSFTVRYGTIKATVPAGATTGPITVVTPSGKAKSTTDFTVT